MPLTPEQIAIIRKKEAAKPDALKRDNLTNYREGYFFITLNTRNESPILSTIEGEVGMPVGSPNAPHCKYTPLGAKVKEMWETIPNFHSTVTIIAAEIMPEHFHGLLFMKQGGNEHLGKVVNGFMIACTHEYWDTLGIQWRNAHPSQPLSNFGGAPPKKSDYKYTDRDHTCSFRGPSLFVRGYNDVVPITQEEVDIKIEYIRQQAERRLIKGEKSDLFKIYRNKHSKNWREDVVMNAIAADRFFKQNEKAKKDAQQNVRLRLNYDSQSIALDYLGNLELLASEKTIPLICHRADAKRFEEQKSIVLQAARNGWTVVSAFISPKEREIRKILLSELLPFIEIMDNGFSDRYKPTGTAFYACGERRMVQISCWNYKYERESVICREMCLVMNELARVISKLPDDWWKQMKI